MLQIATVVKLFPLLLPLWQERPLTAQDLYPGPGPLLVTTEETAMLASGLVLGDRQLRCAIAQQLRQAGTPLASQTLVSHLSKEPDPVVMASFLKELSQADPLDPDVASRLSDMLAHEYAQVRYWAAAVAQRLPEPPLSQLSDLARNDPDALVRGAACAALRRHAPVARLDVLLQCCEDADSVVRAEAFGALAAHGKAPQARVALLAACRDDGHPAARVAIAGELTRLPLQLAIEIAGALAPDTLSTVRAVLVESLGQAQAKPLQDLVHSFAEDADAEVRRVAAAQLAALPGPKTLQGLVPLLSDPSNLVRCQAAASLTAIDPHCSVGDAVAERLTDANPFARCHVCRVLGETRADQHSQTVYEQLRRETIPRNVAAAVFALQRFNMRAVAAPVAALAQHEAPEVRREVAQALGVFAAPATFDVIRRLVFDPDAETRRRAVEAMGRIGAGDAFNATILRVLKSVSETAVTSSLDRATACWAASRVRPIDMAVMKRMVTQATTPVIPVMGVMEFDSEPVLVSAAWALVQCAREQSSVLPLANTVLDIHSAAKSDEASAAEDMGFYPTPESSEYARQARAFLAGRRPEQRPQPPRRMIPVYRRVSRVTTR